jgi:hypothetical protein
LTPPSTVLLAVTCPVGMRQGMQDLEGPNNPFASWHSASAASAKAARGGCALNIRRRGQARLLHVQHHLRRRLGKTSATYATSMSSDHAIWATMGSPCPIHRLLSSWIMLNRNSSSCHHKHCIVIKYLGLRYQHSNRVSARRHNPLDVRKNLANSSWMRHSSRGTLFSKHSSQSASTAVGVTLETFLLLLQ